MVRGCLPVGLLGLAALPSGCVRDRPQSAPVPLRPTAPSASVALAASSASAAVSQPVASNAAQPPEPIRVHLEFQSARSGQPGQLFVAAPALNLRQAVQEVLEPLVCLAAQPGDSIKSARSKQDHQRRLLEASCDPAARTRAYVEVVEDALVLFPEGQGSEERIALPPGRAVVLDPILHAPPTSEECKHSAGPALDVHVQHTDLRQEYPGGRGLVLRVPSLKIDVPLFADSNARAAAHSAAVYTQVVRPRVLVLDVVGSSDGHSAAVWLTVEEGLLRVRTRWIDKVSQGRETFGAIRLPCASTVRWKTKFARNDNPHNVAPCYRACFEARRRCIQGCYERFADERGELAEPGEACGRGCGDSTAPCFARCESATQGP